MKSGKHADKDGLSNISRKSDDVAKYYDNWADNYEKMLDQWQYEAPYQAASMLRSKLALLSSVLDVGCGTGLAGKALQMAGFKKVDGIDISRRSLEIAERSGVYRSLSEIDLQKQPFPIEPDKYDGLICVGVLTYLTDSTGTLREFHRIVKPGGIIVMTQRNDLFIERNFQEVLENLSKDGVFDRVQISKSRPYLPDNEEFGDKILVHYISCTVL
ncbi:MAG: class I SAM-dependent methyltransferase [SAR324 cluster bacterium]|nr:class I SAM-dependent methyltransferase [SAR324 cluster bacterium]